MTMLDLNNLPPLHEAESIVKDMDADTTLSYINLFRERQVNSPDTVTEEQATIGILLTRHLRTLRESKSRVKKQTNTGPKIESLNDLI